LAPDASKRTEVPLHTVPELAAAATAGKGLTCNETVAVFEQPFVVPVTVYVVELPGEMLTLAEFCPLFHEYEEAPVAVSDAVAPAQICKGLTDAVTGGKGITVTNTVLLLVQLLYVPVTVYTVLTVGLTPTVALAAPLFHE
jgi:hypothetical protein